MIHWRWCLPTHMFTGHGRRTHIYITAPDKRHIVYGELRKLLDCCEKRFTWSNIGQTRRTYTVIRPMWWSTPTNVRTRNKLGRARTVIQAVV